MFENATAFVTGGRTGFIGTNITKRLLARGATVYAHSRDQTKRSNFDPATENLIEVTGDFTVEATIPSDVDYVFHCAAHTSGANEIVNNPIAQVTPNLFMNSRFLEAAAESEVKKLLFISSSAAYPELDRPAAEADGFIGDPSDVYFGVAWMKRYTEKLAEFYFRSYGIEVLIIRPSNVYGPFSNFDPDRAHVLPALMRKFVEKHDPIEVWGTPDVARDFIYVDDFVDGTLAAFENSSGFEVFNIASGMQHTIGESVELIKELTGYRGMVTYNSERPMTIRKRAIDTSKAARLLGFQADTSLRRGLLETLEWYESRLSGTGE